MTKTCITCKSDKPVESFSPKSRGRSHSRCKPCRSSKNRGAHLIRKYGITHGDFTQLLTRQGHKCKICGTTMTKPQVDHNHKTGHVRALLCVPCNLLVGKLETNLPRVKAALAYIKEYS